MSKQALDEQELVTRRCPVCDTTEYTLAYDQPIESIAGIGDIGYHHLINQCTHCGFIYASPLLPEAQILKYYAQMSNYEHPASEGVVPPALIKHIEHQLRLIRSRFEPGFRGRALDIGCSIAYGLSVLQKEHWEVLGLDPSDNCIAISQRQLGVTVRKGFFCPSLLCDQPPFDLIILSHVLEHLLHPGEVIRQLAPLLADKGLVYLEVPNLMKPMGLTGYFTFEHINYFTPVSLTNLVEQNGFEVDSLHCLDDCVEYSQPYPVIAMTIKKSQQAATLENDRVASGAVIEEYRQQIKERLNTLNQRIATVLENTAPGRLALWGAGIHTSQLLSETLLKQAEIHVIYDNDAKKAGKQINAIPIRQFPANVTAAKQEIDAILISSQASEAAIHAQLSPLEAEGIRIYRLYS